MKRLLLYLMIMLPVLSGCTGSPAVTKPALGQEFSLAIGQSATIAGEDLTIGFKDVVEDSRCPKNVTCIWAGRVSCIIDVSQAGKTEQTVLTEPGLTGGTVPEEYRNYTFAFRVEPYPEAGKQIAKSDYRLFLTVNKR